MVAWSVECLLHQKCHLLVVDQIPLGETIPTISMFNVYMVPTPTDVCYKLLNQSGLTTQIRTRPRATQQGHVKCRHHITFPAVPTQEAISEKADNKKIK